MSEKRHTRRYLLAGTVAGLTASLAGCASPDDEDDDDDDRGY